MELFGCNGALPILGELHMDKVLGKGVACGSEVDEEKSDPEPMPGCVPKVCGMEGLTVVDANEGLTLGG